MLLDVLEELVVSTEILLVSVEFNTWLSKKNKKNLPLREVKTSIGHG